MSKFKVGDRVRVSRYAVNSSRIAKGKTGVLQNRGNIYDWKVSFDDPNEAAELFFERDLELIKGEQTMGRRTFRLLKETYEYKKGALFQEMCDDGDQDFEILGKSALKYDTVANVIARSVVTSESKWFEEVFPLVPEYGVKLK